MAKTINCCCNGSMDYSSGSPECECYAPHGEECDYCTGCLPAQIKDRIKYNLSRRSIMNGLNSHHWYDSTTGKRIGKKLMKRTIAQCYDAFMNTPDTPILIG